MGNLKENAPPAVPHDHAHKRTTPYEEIMQFLHMGGKGEIETLDGGGIIVEHTPDGDIPSPIGEVEEDDRPVKGEEEIPFSSLSPEAHRLYKQLKTVGRVP